MEFIECLFVLEGVHTLPESIVTVGHQFIFFDQSFKWLMNQFFTVLNIVKDFLFEDEKSAVDRQPCIGGVLDAVDSTVVIQAYIVEGLLGLDTQKTGSFSGVFEKPDHLVQGNIRQCRRR